MSRETPLIERAVDILERRYLKRSNAGLFRAVDSTHLAGAAGAWCVGGGR